MAYMSEIRLGPGIETTRRRVLKSVRIFKMYGKQEVQPMQTNPRDTFRGQSRSPNMVRFDMLDRYGSLSVCYSNFVLRKIPWPWNQCQGSL